jgi:hypothetical protein
MASPVGAISSKLTSLAKIPGVSVYETTVHSDCAEVVYIDDSKKNAAKNVKSFLIIEGFFGEGKQGKIPKLTIE